LRPGWQWPQASEPVVRIETERGGRLLLSSADDEGRDPLSAVLSQPTTATNYVATTLVEMSGMKQGALAGLSAYNGREDALGVLAGDGKVVTYAREAKKHQVITSVDAGGSPRLYLRMTVSDGSRYRFAFSRDGREWKEVGGEIQGSYLEGVRIALSAGGTPGAAAKFEWLRITP
jgi:hypothetical protein